MPWLLLLYLMLSPPPVAHSPGSEGLHCLTNFIRKPQFSLIIEMQAMPDKWFYGFLFSTSHIVSPSYFDTIECSLLFGANNSCERLFQVLITAEGVCFSFNLLPNRTLFSPTTVQYAQEFNNSKPPIWSLEKGYVGGAGITRQPIRAVGTGLKRGVAFVLKTNMSELDYECRRTQGFRVSLTNPAEIPADNSFYYLPTSGLTLMAIEPKVMDTSEGLRFYSPYKRHCFFPSERRLTYFSTYTQSNCELECLTNFTLRSCNCVEFYMPILFYLSSWFTGLCKGLIKENKGKGRYSTRSTEPDRNCSCPRQDFNLHYL
ncbi:hypothetical protein J6590_046398 [Homalodisca vitripennis]|nr:hypothetical protein J6590_046398 [Homalodisca vitripennis]